MKKTKLEALKEIFPNMLLDEDGYPSISCIENYDKNRDTSLYDCPWVCEDCMKKFLDEEIEVSTREPNDTEKILAALNELNIKVEQLETLIRISYPTNVTGAPSNRIPEVNMTLLSAIHIGREVNNLGEVIISKEDFDVKMD